ncbi:hypothetical protein GCM10020331_002500 [Ectobacillus funiculus]
MKGFRQCEAGSLVRPSYHADEQVNAAKCIIMKDRTLAEGENLMMITLTNVALNKLKNYEIGERETPSD